MAYQTMAYPNQYNSQHSGAATEADKEASCPNYLPGMLAHMSTIASTIMLVIAALSPQRSYPIIGSSGVVTLNKDFYLYKMVMEVDLNDIDTSSTLSIPKSAVINYDLPDDMTGTYMSSLLLVAGSAFALLCISIPMAFFVRNVSGGKRYAYPIILFIAAGYVLIAIVAIASAGPSDTDIPQILIDQDTSPMLPDYLSYGFLLLVLAMINIMCTSIISAAYIRTRAIRAQRATTDAAGQPMMHQQQGPSVNTGFVQDVFTSVNTALVV